MDFSLHRRRFFGVTLPRSITRLGRYDSKAGDDLQPRHILLLLTLAARKFLDKPIQARWVDVANDLGVKVGTCRHWGYELRDMGLLRIRRAHGRDRTNRRCEFDIGGFVDLVQKAHCGRVADRKNRIEKEGISASSTASPRPI